MLSRGFINDDHRLAFEVGRALVRRGGEHQRICGARTKGGGLCRSAPLKGHWRCLRHAGPKAARELRKRQLRALATGSLSVVAFTKLEAKRERNRLHNLWKRDPWIEGETINLGDREEEFRRAVGGVLRRCSPADADWLRWRYRRLMIDQRREERWDSLLRHDLPDRLARAKLGESYRTDKGAPQSDFVGVSDDHDELGEAIAAVVRSRVAGIRWLWEPTTSARERRRILLLLVELDQNPNAGAYQRWVDVLVERDRHARSVMDG